MDTEDLTRIPTGYEFHVYIRAVKGFKYFHDKPHALKLTRFETLGGKNYTFSLKPFFLVIF